MDSDDHPVGQILSRRDALKLLGVGSAALFTWSAVPGSRHMSRASSIAQAPLSCVVRPELAIGPYFVDDQLNRSDIRFEPADGSTTRGAPLTLVIGVFDVSSSGCDPLEGAQVDAVPVAAAFGQTIDAREEVEALLEPVRVHLDMA